MSGFLKQVGYVAGGSAAGQALVIAATPLITRLYSPSVVGIWALFNATALTLAVIANLRYELAIVLPDADEDGFTVLILCLVSSVGVASLLAVGLAVVHPSSLNALGLSPLWKCRWLLPVVIALAGPSQALNYWLVRIRRFRAIALATIAQSAMSVAVQVGYAELVGRDALGLMLGTAVGYLASVVIMIAFVKVAGANRPLPRWRLTGVMAAAKKHRNFPLFVTPYGLIAQVTNRALIFFAVSLGQSTPIAFLALAYRLTFLPVSLIGSALRSVVFSRAARELGTPTFGPFVAQILTTQIFVGAPLLAWFEIDAPTIFGAVLGPQWTVAGDYARWMAIPAAAILMNCWLDRIYDVLGRQRLNLLLELTYDATIMTLYAAAIYLTKNLLFSVAVYAVVSTLYNLFWLIFTLRLAGMAAGPAVTAILGGAAVLVSSATALVLGRTTMGHLTGELAFGGACLIYYAVLYARSRHSRLGSSRAA